MKKLLSSAIVLCVFSLSILIFDFSCRKDSIGQTQSPTTESVQKNKIIYVKINPNTNLWEIWTSNYDGTGAQKINLTLPQGLQLSDDPNIRISPDGKKIFFNAGMNSYNHEYIYSCNIDGSNVKKIVGKDDNSDNIILGEAY